MGNIDTRAIRATVLAALIALAAGCGGSDEPAKAKGSAKSRAGKEAAAKAASADDRFASAVYLEKGMPAVDVQYDLRAKPMAGQPLEIELSLEPRLNADLLEFSVTGMPGLDVVSGGAASFQNTQGHQRYTAKVLIQPVQPGVYYLSVTAKASSKVQSDEVSYSVPVVVAAPPAGSAAAQAVADAQSAGAAQAAATTQTAAPTQATAAPAKP